MRSRTLLLAACAALALLATPANAVDLNKLVDKASISFDKGVIEFNIFKKDRLKVTGNPEEATLVVSKNKHEELKSEVRKVLNSGEEKLSDIADKLGVTVKTE